MAPRAKVEKRLDRETGVKYTEEEFLEFYGNKKGAKIWAAAGRAAESASTTGSAAKSKGKAEKRLDRDTGVKYTEEEFLEFYGNKKGSKIWEAAGRAAEPASASGSGSKKKGKAEKRLDRDTDKKHTEEEFIELYGTKKGSKIWAAAGRAAETASAAGLGAKAKAKATPKVKAKPQTTPKKELKVCVCGGAGGIGQPLCMLMATDPNVSELSVFDLNIAMVPPEGVAADLSHIETKCKVVGYVADKDTKPIDCLEACLTGCSLVLIPAGLPRKPGMTRDDLFKINAGIAKNLVEACAKFCPDAVLALIVNPVNSIVPAMAALYEKKGLNPLNILGVTTLDCVRANKFVGEMTGKNPKFINVPVVGGHAGVTILPLFSQDKSAASIETDKIADLDKKVQDAGTVVVEAKNGKGSATLSMAYAGARMGSSILKGLQGIRRVECAYVKSDHTDLPYFASKVVLGEKGVSKVLPLGELNEYETTRLEEVKTALKVEIETGLAYAKDNELA